MFKRIISKKKLVIILSFLAITFFVIGICNLRKGNATAETCLQAMPQNAGIVFRSSNLPVLLRTLQHDNAIWNELKRITTINELDNILMDLDSVLIKNEDALDVLEGKPCLFGLFSNDKGKLNYLLITGLSGSSDEKDAINFMTETFQGKNTLNETSFEGTSVFEICPLQKDKKTNMWYACNKQNFVLSNKIELIEKAVKQQNTQKTLLQNSIFAEAWNSSNPNNILNIYINFKEFPKIAEHYFDNNYKYFANSAQNFSEWAYLGLNMNDDEYYLNGSFLQGDSSIKYSKIFAGLSSGKPELVELLPENTASMLAFYIDDFNKLKTNYKTYLDGIGKLQTYENDLQDIKINYGVDIEQSFYLFLKNEMALAYTKNSLKNLDPYFIAKTIDKEEALKELQKLQENYAKAKAVPITSLTSTLRVNKEEKIEVYTLPYPDILKRLFSFMFIAPSLQYFIFIENYIVMGNSPAALLEFFQSYKAEKLLRNLKSFETAASNFQKSNIYFYSNIPRSSYFYADILNKDLQKNFEINASIINQLETFSFDIRPENNKMKVSVLLKYNPLQEKGVETLWKADLDSIPRTRPQLVYNHATKDKDVFVQDMKNTIYLFDRNGRLIWKRKLEEPIMGEVYQIDYYKNNKLQLILNTRTNLYCIDREGKDVEDFPIKLKSPASSGLAVYDYDNKRDYRILIALTDKRVVVLDKSGKAVKDWAFKQSTEVVNTPIQYCSVKNKDYLIISDKKNSFFLDRKGKKRFEPKENFIRALYSKYSLDTKAGENKTCLVTTDTIGDIIQLDFDGSIKKHHFRNFSAKHLFEFEDIDGDGARDYIFCDEKVLEVYNHNRNRLFTYEFEEDIFDRPIVFKFSEKDRKIGIYLRNKNEIYLINSDGKLAKGFPLPGYGLFTIGFPQLGGDGSIFNLIVAGKNNTLNSYEIR